MRISKTKLLSALALTAVIGCTDEPISTPAETTVALKILSISPESVFVEGGEAIRVTTENGCAVDALEVTVGDWSVADVQADGADAYTFTAPPAPGSGFASMTVTFTCAQAPGDQSYGAGENIATTTLDYDPNLEPAPAIVGHSPTGEGVSILARMVVKFSRAMDPASITDSTVFIEGVDSAVTYNPDTREATVIPREPLAFAQTFTCVVLGGASGVVSLASGNYLETTLKPDGASQIDPARDAWVFTTCGEDDCRHWIGDVAAAAGASENNQYKLFSVTAQPSPVGEAIAGTPESPKYKLQAGFLYATQPPYEK